MLSNEEQLAQDLITADEHLQQGNFQAAFNIYLSLLNNVKTSPEIFNNAAICAYQLNLQDETLRLIRQAISLEPDNPWYLTQYAQFVAYNFIKADELFNQALELAVKDRTLEKYNKIQNINYSTVVLDQIKNCYADFLFNHGCHLAKDESTEQQQNAIELFTKSLSYNSALFKAAYNIACCYINLNDLSNALHYLEKTIEINPNHSQAHFALSQYYQQHNNLEAAEKHLQKSLLSDNINKANAEYNYGVLEQKRLNYQAALDHYVRCLTINPEHFAACYNSASIYHRLKNIDTAVNFYKKALIIKPNDRSCLYLLASLTNNRDQNITQAPLEYVENLFDSYAEKFDHELTNNLEYLTPQYLYTLVVEYVSSINKLNILDLGCGTGLSGQLFQELAHTLTGVDISAKMLEQAHSKNIYHNLIKSDINLYLQSRLKQINHLYDLIIMADVLVYYGELNKVMLDVKNNLSPHGYVVFSIELDTESNVSQNYKLQDNGRFVHSTAYIEQLMRESSLKIIATQELKLRKQNNSYVPGAICLVQNS